MTRGIALAGFAAGLLAAASFPPFDLTFVAFVALVPLLHALEGIARSGRIKRFSDCGGVCFAAGWIAGTVFFLFLLWWIVLLDAPALTIPWVRYPGTLAIAAYLGLYWGLFASAYVWVRSQTQLSPILAAVCLFTAAELARSYWELGFPWGHLAYSQAEFLPGLQLASLVGVHGVTAWIVSVNGIILELLRSRKARLPRAAILALVLSLPIAWGLHRLSTSEPSPTLSVALVQPNISNAAKWDPALRGAHFENLAELSAEGVAQGAQLVVWPETAAPCYLLKDRRWRPFVEQLVQDLGVPVFLGLPDYQRVGRDRVTYTNTAALFDTTGAVERMDKIELVPFGERIPFSQWFGPLERLDFGEADFRPGDKRVLFDLRDAKFANLVCFESIYPGLSRNYARDGADFLVNITNDSWFGAGSGAESHAEMAIVRAIETGCAIARCANSGISMGIDSRGRRFGVTEIFKRRLSVVELSIQREPTLYTRLPDWVPFAAWGASFALVLGAFVRRTG